MTKNTFQANTQCTTGEMFVHTYVATEAVWLQVTFTIMGIQRYTINYTHNIVSFSHIQIMACVQFSLTTCYCTIYEGSIVVEQEEARLK